jgi:hypothetical protein
MRRVIIFIICIFCIYNIYAQNSFNFRGFEWGSPFEVIRDRSNIVGGRFADVYDRINDNDRENLQGCLIEFTEVAGYDAKAVYLFSKIFYRQFERSLVKAYYKLYSNSRIDPRSYFENNNSYDYISSVFIDLRNKLTVIYGSPLINNNITTNIYNRAMQNKEDVVCNVLWETGETTIELYLQYHYYFGNTYSTKDVWEIYIIYKDMTYYRLMEEQRNQDNNRRRESTDGL